MQRILTRPPIVRPPKTMRWICFLASASLLGLMIAQGFPVRSHPLRPNQLVIPEQSLSKAQWYELFHRHDFLYVATVNFLTSPTGSNQTFNKPSDWNDSNNSIEVIAAGGSGGSCQRTSHECTGGGGGEYGKTTNFTFTGSSATYQIGTGGAAINPTVGSTVDTAGNNGGDTWWNGTTQAGSTLGAIHGNGGAAALGNQNGGAGGTGGVGTTHNAGGRGGNITGGTKNATGGGGAGGTTAAGSTGVDTSTTSAATNGGAGGTASGGTGGSGSTTNGTPGGDGGTGTVFDSTHGAGGGGGAGTFAVNSAQSGGAGGLYGGGSGACGNSGAGGGGSTAANVKKGSDGIVVVTWTPAVTAVFGGAFSEQSAANLIGQRQVKMIGYF